MKKAISILTFLLGVLVLMMSPLGSTEVKAAGKVLGAVHCSDVCNYVGDYIGAGTTITGYSIGFITNFIGDAPGHESDCVYDSISEGTLTYNDYVDLFNSLNVAPDSAYFDQSMVYNAFEITSDSYNTEIYLRRVYLAPATTTSTNTGTLCSHDYEWETEIEPTDNEDGEEQLKCTKCGNVIQRQTLSAYPTYIESCMKKISDANDGATVTLTSHKWNSYPKSVFDAIAAKNITVTIEYPDELHHMYTYTVTSEQAKAITGDYAGPETMKVLGATELVK